MSARIAPKLRPLIDKLRARYPGVEIVEAGYHWVDRGLQQSIRFVAPLEELTQCGLVTAAMIECAGDWRRGGRATPIGDGFHLCQGLDALSLPGCWDLLLFTGAAPRERKRIAVKDAAKLLKRFTLAKVKAK